MKLEAMLAWLLSLSDRHLLSPSAQKQQCYFLVEITGLIGRSIGVSSLQWMPICENSRNNDNDETYQTPPAFSNLIVDFVKIAMIVTDCSELCVSPSLLDIETNAT
jgi:hypothetical protein